MAQLFSLSSLAQPIEVAQPRIAGCVSSGGPADMPRELWAKVQDHPCYSEEAHHYFARMHAAVAPACNIQCNYCNRKYDCANESRPGVVSETLTPQQALRKVTAVANAVPQLSVLGIAGPGDACYDWQKTRATFALVAERIPDIRLCLSTNGLALPEHVDEIAALHIEHVTITINMVDPEIGALIYPWIFHDHRHWVGLEASKILHERQMLGLDMLVARGILVKVNSVMIPGINDDHLIEVNRMVKAKGAFLHNVMPLISEASHGTHFGLTGQLGPTAMELKALQERLAGGARLMRHCRQCRADAVGLLGEDRGQDFMLDRLEEQAAYDASRHAAYREVIVAERSEHAAEKRAAEQRLGAMQAAPAVLLAIATHGGGRINQHFGHAREFQVFEASPQGIRFIGHRKAKPYCQGGSGEDSMLDDLIATLVGISAVLCARIGDCPRERLLAAGIVASDAQAHEWIEAGIAAWYAATYHADVRRTA